VCARACVQMNTLTLFVRVCMCVCVCVCVYKYLSLQVGLFDTVVLFTGRHFHKKRICFSELKSFLGLFEFLGRNASQGCPHWGFDSNSTECPETKRRHDYERIDTRQNDTHQNVTQHYDTKHTNKKIYTYDITRLCTECRYADKHNKLECLSLAGFSSIV
jgi:hypothetical protein